MNPYQLTFLVNERCNLRCAYCNCDTSPRTATLSIEKAIEEIEFIRCQKQKLDFLKILLMGGEPLLEYAFIQRLVEYVRTIREFPVLIKAVTNGTLVGKDKEIWLTANQDILQLSLSIDGKKESHNKNRGRSFDRINIPFFAKTYPQTAVSCTISPNTVEDMADNIIYLHSLGFLVKAVFAEGVEWQDGADQIIYEQLSKLTNFYVSSPDIQPFNLLNNALWLMKDPSRIDQCKPYKNMHCIDSHGKKYACHRCSDYWNQGTWTIPSDSLSLNIDERMMGKCRNCPFEKFCNSCPAAVASNQKQPQLLDAICKNNRAMYRANAELALTLFLYSPKHIYFKSKTEQQVKELLDVALQIINQKIKIIFQFQPLIYIITQEI